MKQHPATPMENARVGLAGPLWGLGAAVTTYAVFLMTDMAGFAAIARMGAWINLFNLLPVPPLDGGRGFQALTGKQRWIAATAIGAAWFLTSEGLLLLLLIGAVAYALKKTANLKPDTVSLYQYIGLVAVLSWMCMIGVPVE
jgi:Zn-dependent protease